MATYNMFLKGIEVPTLDALNSNFLSKTNTAAYNPTANYNPATKKYVDDCIAAINQLHFEIVEELPATGESTIIYMVLADDGGEEDYYNEYIYINDTWEKIGSTRIDLTPYATIEYVDASAVKLPKYYVLAHGSYNNEIPTSQYSKLVEIVNYYLKYDSWPYVSWNSDSGCNVPLNNVNINKNAYYVGITFNLGLTPAGSNSGTSWGISYRYLYGGSAFTIYVKPSEFEDGEVTNVYSDSALQQQTRISVGYSGGGVARVMAPSTSLPLGTTNTVSFTPTGDYNPATKKYVDDAVAGIPQPDLSVLPLDVSSENEVKTYTYISSSLPYASQRDSHLVLSFFDSADDALYFVNDMYHHGYSNAQIFIWPDDMIGNRRQMIYPITVSILNVDFATKKTMTPTTYFDLYATFIDLTGWGTNGYFGMESARAMLASIEYDSVTDSFVKTSDTPIPYFQGSTSVSKIPTKSYVDGLPAEFLNKYIKFAELDYQGNLDWNNFDVNTWYILPQGYDLGTYDANGIFVAQSGNYNSGDRNPKTTLRMISLFATKNHKSSMQYVKFICLAPNPSTWMLNGLHTGILYATASTGASTTSDSAYYSLPSITFSGLMSESTFDVTERTVTARQTFSTYAPRTTVVPTNDNDITNKKYVDDALSNMMKVLYIDDYSTSGTALNMSELDTGIYYITRKTNATTLYLKPREGATARAINDLDGRYTTILVYTNKIPATYSGVTTFNMYQMNANMYGHYLFTDSNTSFSTAWTEQSASVGLSGSQTISGTKTFSTIPRQSNTNAPTLDTQFTNKKYVDDNIPKIVALTQLEYDALDPPDSDTYYFIKES